MIDKPQQQERQQRRREEAAQWSLALRHAELSAEQAEQWLEWSHADPANLAAFNRAEALAAGLDSLAPERKSELLHRFAPQYTPARRRWTYVLAAGVALVSIGIGYGVFQQRMPFTTTYVTDKAKNREVVLPDGTAVVLGAGTQLDVAYTRGQRAVELRNGEAYFKVEQALRWPFTVRVGDYHVTDIGTSFDIRKSGAHVTVTVAEGIVDVRPLQGASGISAHTPVYRLKAGEQMRADPVGKTPVLAKIDIATTASWRAGRLDFQDEPLSVVIANVNRYADSEVVIVDPRVARMRFTGTVFQNRIDDWLAATSQLFDLRAQSTADGRVLLYAGR